MRTECFLPGKYSAPCQFVNRDEQFAFEIDALRGLCTEIFAPDERRKLVQFLSQYQFVALEHAVVFESLQSLSRRGPVSKVQLRVHLNNRGFPDTDVEKYFHRPQNAGAGKRSPDKPTS